jgi:hypothetical protein
MIALRQKYSKYGGAIVSVYKIQSRTNARTPWPGGDFKLVHGAHVRDFGGSGRRLISIQVSWLTAPESEDFVVVMSCLQCCLPLLVYLV